MAKGAIAKSEVIAKIKEIFPEAFEYGKELRIPLEEDGQRVEIKVALTCAKVNVGDGEIGEGPTSVPTNTPAATVPTEEEKQNIANLMNVLGI